MFHPYGRRTKKSDLSVCKNRLQNLGDAVRAPPTKGAKNKGDNIQMLLKLWRKYNSCRESLNLD